jgi:hypothetical protein
MAGRSAILGGVTMRVVWGMCLVVAAMATAIGFELYAEGAAPAVSYGLVVGGVLLPVLASHVIQRMAPAPDRRV